MEEPLLGSFKRSNLSFGPTLFQIPEEAPVHTAAIPVLSSSPSSIKERIIYGSPEISPRSQFSWIDYGSSSEERANEGDDQPLVDSDEQSVCASCGNAINESTDPFQDREEEIELFDDSFMDNRSIGSYRTARNWWMSALTRLDLDGRDAATAIGSPRSPSMIPRPQLGKADIQAPPRQQDEETENLFRAIAINPEVGTTCHPCLKKILHRSRTAPAMTVMADRPKLELKLKTPPRLSSSLSIVSQAFIGLMLYLAVGVMIYTWRESDFSGSSTHAVVDALYFCIVTLCTIGYGDITPTTPLAKLFSCAFVLVGFGFVDILLSGMVSYVLDKQEALLLSAVSAGHHDTAKNYLVDIKKGRMRIRSKVALAFGVVIMCIGVGTLVMHFVESLGWLDSLYLSCMSVTTVGYGDRAFKTMAGRLFASIWLLVSTLAVARSFLYLAEARIDKRHRLIAKWILEKEMTIGDLVAADLDNDGCVSKSDFVVYKLKEMGKIEEKDILEICRQFGRLDTDNSGKITLSCLINLHEASTAKT